MVAKPIDRQVSPARSATDYGAPHIAPMMTVNHVLKIHPAARDVFQAFQIDCDLDGIHCLEELYWRRGVDVEALLQALNHSASTAGR